MPKLRQDESRRLMRYGVFAVAGWFLLLAALYVYNSGQYRKDAISQARIEARTAAEKDILTRRWNATLGGVYAAVTPTVQPNPLLAHLPERDILTPSGKQLTLINPAYMTRQIHELQAKQDKIYGHITSLKPIRKQNAPDPWEQQALQKLQSTPPVPSEFSELVDMQGKPHLRLIMPLVTEKPCLQCHAIQGYQEGDIRGGISVAVPMEPYYAILQTHVDRELRIYALIFAIGLAAIALGTRRLMSSTDDLARRERTLRGITEAALDAIVMADPQGRLVLWNPSAEQLFGYSQIDSQEKFIGELFERPDIDSQGAEALPVTMDELIKGQALSEALAVTASGARMPVELARSTFTLEGKPYAVCIVRDITGRRQAMRMLLSAKAAAEAASLAKSTFLANMSHEIRTPLNGMLGMLDLSLCAEHEPEQRENLLIARTCALSLNTALNDILDYSKLEAGKFDLRPEPLDLRELMEHTLGVFARHAHQKGLELTLLMSTELPDRAIVADPQRLRQVLSYLLDNAIKFTSFGEVCLRVEPAAHLHCGEQTTDGIALLFSVQDTGIGIEPEHMEAIFEGFHQADQTSTRSYGGTGLGLAICKSIVAMMGGQIWAASTPGKGSTFQFTASFHLGAPLSSTAPAPGVAGLRAMVADDNPNSRLVTMGMLGQWGALVEGAANAYEAMNLLRNASEKGEPFALLVLDYHMPGVDGLELTARICADPQLNSLRIVLQSNALLEGTQADRAIKAGVAAFIKKPVRKLDLAYTLRVALGEHESPCSRASCLSPDMQDGPGRAGHGQAMPRVLVLEDDVVAMGNILTVLRGAACIAQGASSPAEAFSKLASESFDALIVDSQLPEMDGFEVTRKIRSSPPGSGIPAGIPIIAINGQGMLGARQKCLLAGMEDCITEPVESATLFEVLGRVLGVSVAMQGADHTSHRPPPVDVNRALKSINGDRQFLVSLWQMFIEQAGRDVATMLEAIENGDASSVHRIAHSLKSTSHVIGAYELSARARDLDEVARTGQMELARTLVPEFKAVFAETIEFLKEESARG